MFETKEERMVIAMVEGVTGRIGQVFETKEERMVIAMVEDVTGRIG